MCVCRKLYMHVCALLDLCSAYCCDCLHGICIVCMYIFIYVCVPLCEHLHMQVCIDFETYSLAVAQSHKGDTVSSDPKHNININNSNNNSTNNNHHHNNHTGSIVNTINIPSTTNTNTNTNTVNTTHITIDTMHHHINNNNNSVHPSNNNNNSTVSIAVGNGDSNVLDTHAHRQSTTGYTYICMYTRATWLCMLPYSYTSAVYYYDI